MVGNGRLLRGIRVCLLHEKLALVDLVRPGIQYLPLFRFVRPYTSAKALLVTLRPGCETEIPLAQPTRVGCLRAPSHCIYMLLSRPAVGAADDVRPIPRGLRAIPETRFRRSEQIAPLWVLTSRQQRWPRALIQQHSGE